jgi:hypothetical protein
MPASLQSNPGEDTSCGVETLRGASRAFSISSLSRTTLRGCVRAISIAEPLCSA